MRSTLETRTAPVPAAAPLIGAEERAAVMRVLDSGMLAQGPEVAAFEDEFSAHVDGRRCVAVNSGTSALLLSLLAIGIGPGDEVIVPSFSFAATANAVVLAGARPVFADIEPEQFCLNPAAVAAAVGPRTAAIMPVHLYGHPAPMAKLTAIAEANGLAIVEDAAQAHLASLHGRQVGTFGAVAAFSFYPTKNMTAGEGGMVACADGSTARRIRMLRNQGMERRYENEVVGYNARMSDLHAAIGRVQLRRLPCWTSDRRRIAEYLTGALQHLEADGRLTVPRVAASARPVWHQYTIRSRERDRMVADLSARGIGAGVYYPIPIHRLPAYSLELDLPETARAAHEVLSLPVHPALTASDVRRVADAVMEVAVA
jgi:dTDP-4-amino-4,6-dideoxygalactose transaminase